MIRALAIVGLVALTGCAATQKATDDLARGQAKRFVNIEMAQRFPGKDVSPATDCVIDNATSGELFTLARASFTGGSPEAAQTIVSIIARPATAQCLLKNGSLLL